MENNIYSILGIQSREDCVSNAIVYAFNESDKFRSGFLREICRKAPENYCQCQAYTRVSAGKSGIPDMVFVCQTASSVDLIIIENKIKAEEGKDQTVRYASQKSIEVLRKKLDIPKDKNVNPVFVFLTLFPNQMPASGKYLHALHSQLTKIYKPDELKTKDCDLSDKLIRDWITLISRFYSKLEINEDDAISEILKDDDGLDGNYLGFCKIISSLSFPAGLKIKQFFRLSHPGRHYYGAVISKLAWNVIKKKEINSLNFNIHFEPQYNVLKGCFDVFLHYEVYPYEPKKELEKHTSEKEIENYNSIRECFVDELIKSEIKGWKFSEASNQIAKAEINFQGKTFKDVKGIIESLFNDTAIEIDRILEIPVISEKRN